MINWFSIATKKAYLYNSIFNNCVFFFKNHLCLSGFRELEPPDQSTGSPKINRQIWTKSPKMCDLASILMKKRLKYQKLVAKIV